MRLVTGSALAFVAALCGGCRPGGESWAESKLTKIGAEELRAEASAFLGERGPVAPNVELTAVRCPSPRVVLDVYARMDNGPRLEYSRVNTKLRDTSSIRVAADVQCLVLAAHDAEHGRRHFKEWMVVRFVDRASHTEQVVRVEGNDSNLIEALDRTP